MKRRFFINEEIKRDFVIVEKGNRIEQVSNEVVEKSLAVLQDKIDRIILYGSYARGDFDEESDIDFFILLKCSHDELLNYRHAIAHISSEVSLDYDIEVSIMMEDRMTYEKWMDALYFYKNVRDEGVMLYAG